MPNNARHILHVEDDPNDVALMALAFEKSGLTHPVQVARDGQVAIDYLAGVGPFADRAKYPFPSLLLLDLNIPKVNGHDVLRWIHSQPALSSLIVIVLSASDHPAQVNAALKLGAKAYFVKPTSNFERLQLAKAIGHRLNEDACPPSGSLARQFDRVFGRFRPEVIRR